MSKVKKTKEALLPQNIEAEQALLGCIFLDNEVLFDVASIVKAGSYFYRTRHGIIYESMLRLFNQGLEIDWIALGNELEKQEKLEVFETKAELVNYLHEITESVPITQSASQYAEIIRDKYILREIIRTVNEVQEEAYHARANSEELIDRFEQQVFALGNKRFHQNAHSMQELLVQFQEQLEHFKRLRSENNAVSGLPTGYKDLDRISTGFHPGQLLVLAARPGHGKTSLALNIAAHVAASAHNRENGGGVAFFSLEMTGVELVSRVLCSEIGMSLRDLREGRITKAQERSLTSAKEALASYPFFIDDSFTLNMTEIRAKCRRLKERYNIEFVIVDYLQLIHGSDSKDRHEQIAIISRGLKALARELQVPVLALSQLNRSIEQRRGVQQRPMLSDLRESGAIEQDADMVMFIQRDRMLDASKLHEAQEAAKMLDEVEAREALDIEEATLIVAKNRSGPVADVDMYFRKSCTRFEPKERRALESFRE